MAGACGEQRPHMARGRLCGQQAELRTCSDCQNACAAGRKDLSQPTSPWTQSRLQKCLSRWMRMRSQSACQVAWACAPLWTGFLTTGEPPVTHHVDLQFAAECLSGRL